MIWMMWSVLEWPPVVESTGGKARSVSVLVRGLSDVDDVDGNVAEEEDSLAFLSIPVAVPFPFPSIEAAPGATLEPDPDPDPARWGEKKGLR